ncbi:MAG: WG repeat-containing protein [Bacteroidota bacterium]
MPTLRPWVFVAVLLAAPGCTATLVEPSVDETGRPATAIAQAQVAAGADRFPIAVGGRYGYIDRSGSVVVEPQFDEAHPFAEGLARVKVRSRYGYIDPDGGSVIAPRFRQALDFSNGRARVVLPETDLEAYIDVEGATVVAPNLAEARDFAQTPDGLLAPVIRAETTEYLPFGSRLFSFLSTQSRSVGAWEVIRADGEVAFALDEAQNVLGYAEGRFPYAVNAGVWPFVTEQWGYLDAAGDTVIEPQFQLALRFSEGLAPVVDGGRFGYVDTTGALVIEPQFELAGAFREGLAPVRQEGRWGFADASGRLAVTPQYDLAFAFSGGRALVQQGDRFGFVAPDGTEVLPPRFGYARSFLGGLAFVREGEREGYIDPDGTFVWSQLTSR